MKIEPPEVTYVTVEESAEGQARLDRALDVILDHLLEKYRMKQLQTNKKLINEIHKS